MPMRILTSMLKQACAYWAPGNADGFGGFSYSAPVWILCRWEDRQEKFIDDNGQEILSRALVYVDQDVEVGGYLILSDDLDSSGAVPSDPTDSATEAWQIGRFEKLPTLKADGYLRTCYLK